MGRQKPRKIVLQSRGKISQIVNFIRRKSDPEIASQETMSNFCLCFALPLRKYQSDENTKLRICNLVLS